MAKPDEFHSFQSPMNRTAASFQRLGWLGFWLQVLFGALPILMWIASVFFSPAQLTNRPVPWWTYLAYLCPIALIFTIYWCYRYTRLSPKLLDPELRPPRLEVIQLIRFGLLVNLTGMAFAIIVLLGQVTTLWFRISLLPTGSSTITTPLPGTTVVNSGAIILPLQMMGILAMVCTIAAEWVGTFISLILLYQVNQYRNSVPSYEE
jgi:hypothetical protein